MSSASSAHIHKILLRSVRLAAEDVYQLSFDAPNLASRIRPGQFISMAVPNNATQLARVPLSCAHVDCTTGVIEVYLAVVGDKTRRLASLQPGDVVDVLGPNGHGWKMTTTIKRALIIGKSRGMIPLLMLAEWFFHHDVTYDAVISAEHAKKLMGIDQLRLLGCSQICICTDDGSTKPQCSPEDSVLQLLGTTSYDAFYTCGPEPMMKAIVQIAKDAQVPCQVSLERMMLCGFGACGVCTVSTTKGPACCCMKGPVFDGGDVIW